MSDQELKIVRQKKSLLIISDTPVIVKEGVFYVFEPTLNEIEGISSMFSNIVWRTYLRGGTVSGNLREIQAPSIKIQPLNFRRGGNTFLKKIRVLITTPIQFYLIVRNILNADVVHTRGPSVPALLTIIYSFFDSSRTYWHKYAGNWVEPNSPLAYKFQRWLLNKLNKPNVVITINGHWPGLHTGFRTYENPCINESVLAENLRNGNVREYDTKLKVCFVGSLDENKGAIRLAKVLLDPEFSQSVEGVWFIGDGEQKDLLVDISRRSHIPFNICGFMSRRQIFEEIYSQCHILILPSESEGFPKVVAEAAAHFCIPVVTGMSSLDQYINSGVNGYLLPDASEESIKQALRIIISNQNSLKRVAQKAFELSRQFTYERFRDRINVEILKSDGVK